MPIIDCMVGAPENEAKTINVWIQVLRPAQILIGWSIAFNLKCSSVALYASCIVDSTLLTAAMWLLRTYVQVAIASLIVVISNTRNVSILFLLPLLYLDWFYSEHFSSKFCHHRLTELGICHHWLTLLIQYIAGICHGLTELLLTLLFVGIFIDWSGWS